MTEADLLVGASVAAYVPRSVDSTTWGLIAPKAREWVLASDVDLGPRAVQRLKPLAQYLAWRHDGGMNIDDPEKVFQSDDIETFFREGCNHLVVGTRSTYRSALRTIGERVAGFDVACPGRTLPIAKPVPKTPYSPAELAALLSATRGRSSASQRQNTMALIVLARGAGLGAGDIASLLGTDIEQTSDGSVAIHLRGPSPRVAIALARWEGQVANVAKAAGNRLVFRSTRTRVSRNDIGRFCDRLDWSDAPGLSVTRLRITWIVEHLAAGTPLTILSKATGVSPMGLARYARFAEVCTDQTAADLLRAPGSLT